MSASVTALPFKGDLIDYIKLRGRAIEWLWRDGEAYIPVKPICDLLGLAWQPQHRKLTAPETGSVITFMVTTGTDGKRYEMLCIAYPDFMMWLATISPGRVKEEAREAVSATRAEIKALIARHYHDRLFGEVAACRRADERLLVEIISRRPIYGWVHNGAILGWTVDQIRLSTNYSGRKIAEAAEYLYRLGVIDRLPEGMPARQIDLFAAG